MMTCAGNQRRDVEREMQAAVVGVSSALNARGVENAAAFVATSQQDWERYRTSHCELLSKLYEGGSLARVTLAFCLRDVARERLVFLQSLEHSSMDE